MKKTIYVIALLLLVGITNLAHQLNTSKVTTTVQTAFSKSHPSNSEVGWSKKPISI